MSERILLVEDEKTLYESLKLNLELEGYKVILATDGQQALDKFRNGHFDLIILDVMLPEIDGFDVCETIRLENAKVPILFLSAKNTSMDKVEGLKRGGDDYLGKPFDLQEFLMRVKVLNKRGKALSADSDDSPDVVTFGDNRVDFSSYEITTWKGEHKQLSAKEIKLLKLLVEKQGEVVSREEILRKVWGYNTYPFTRTIDNYILAFRKYFEKNPRQPEFIFSIRGVGYKMILKR